MKKIFGLMLAVLLVAACGDSNDRLFKKAQLATTKGEYNKAIQLYARIIKQDPQHAAALVNRAILWERLPAKDAKERAKNRDYAENDYLRAMEADPTMVEVYNNLGALYVDEGRYSDATFQLTEAIARNPRYFTAYMNRGIAYSHLGRSLAALADFDKAVDLRQDVPLLFLNRGLAYFDQGMYEDAVENYSFLMTLTPNDPRAYLERARAFIRMGYPADAYADLEQAVALKPSYALAYYYMGDLMYRKGETDYALALLVKSKELASQYVPTYDLMGDMLVAEDPVAATANYLVAKKLDPANAAKYERKIRFMRSQQGRERILAERFFPKD